MPRLLTIATRKSPLALWQAEFVRDALSQAHPGLEVVLLGMTSRGDEVLDTALAKIGGKGLFVKELETALLDHTADIAVHSMKDVPMELPPGLCLGAICQREDPRDALVSSRYSSLDQVPQGAVVGTSSLRRECQLRERRPDLDIKFLRGNVNTRLRKLDEGQYDAIVLACAGLIRLGMEDRIAQPISTGDSVPAVGQGAVVIELRDDDEETAALLAPLHHTPTAQCVSAERAVNRRLGGSCHVPLAAFAEHEDADTLLLHALVGRPDGSEILRAHASGPATLPDELGLLVADQLLELGAAEILADV